MGRVIAIDGPSGAGKSTAARMLAEIIGFSYLDTGALYRAVALGLVRAGVRPEDGEGRVKAALDGISIDYSDGRVFLGEEDVSEEIRSPEVGHHASVFSAMRPVREFLLPVQKKASEADDLVAEGRDMTTVVFPGAWKKFYLDATIEARTKRRYQQLRMNGVPIDMEHALEDVVGRDKRDSSRDLAPLKVAEDAVFIDTSEMSVEDVIKRVLDEIRKG